MGRGRRPNLALEPTRALQTQRAFRQRKAEHLANLEESVKTLSEENAKLRKLLHLGSPPSISPSASPSGSVKPVYSVQSPTLISTTQQTCENCAHVQQANKQLALAAEQVEAQMAQLQQSIQALRSVLMHHNIPIPPTPAPLDADERLLKRQRFAEADSSDHTTAQPHGVHMTYNYFSATTPSSSSSTHDPYAPSRRTAATLATTTSTSAAAGGAGGAWHTPSPSAILSAPTPPSASGFSPRHYATSPASTSTSAVAVGMSGDEAHYRARNPARQNSGSSNGRQLPPMSPARQLAALPSAPPLPWIGPAGGASTSNLTRAGSYSSPSTNSVQQRRHDEPAYASTSSYTASATIPAEYRYAYADHHHHLPYQHQHHHATAGSRASYIPPLPTSASSPAPGVAASPAYSSSHAHSHSQSQSQSNSPFGSGAPLHSPRSRRGQAALSPRDRDDAEPSARPTAPASADCKSLAPTDKTPNSNAKQCCPPTDPATPRSSSGSKSTIPSTTTSANPNRQPHVQDKVSPSTTTATDWDAPQPLGVSFDMRVGSISTPTPTNQEEECCFGLVKCDTTGRIII